MPSSSTAERVAAGGMRARVAAARSPGGVSTSSQSIASSTGASLWLCRVTIPTQSTDRAVPRIAEMAGYRSSGARDGPCDRDQAGARELALDADERVLALPQQRRACEPRV